MKKSLIASGMVAMLAVAAIGAGFPSGEALVAHWDFNKAATDQAGKVSDDLIGTRLSKTVEGSIS